jgi:hypothetical protein
MTRCPQAIPTPRGNTAPVAAPKGVPPPCAIIGAADTHGVLDGMSAVLRTGYGADRRRIVDRAGSRAAIIDFGGFAGRRQPENRGRLNALRFWRIGSKSDSISLGVTRSR